MSRLPRTAWVSLLAVLALVIGVLPSPASSDPPRRLLVFGDSMALEAKPFLRAELPAWRIRQDVAPARRARDAARALRGRGALLAPVIHLSLGTEDDPERPGAFRRAVRAAMHVAGANRCVVWTNIWRLASDGSGLEWYRLNDVLAAEAAHRPNLIVVDWVAMVAAHPEWLNKRDATHVDEHGSRARARAVAHAVHECRRIAAGGLG